MLREGEVGKVYLAVVKGVAQEKPGTARIACTSM